MRYRLEMLDNRVVEGSQTPSSSKQGKEADLPEENYSDSDGDGSEDDDDTERERQLLQQRLTRAKH